MKKIKLITDSASDISLEIAEELGIHIIPLMLTFGDETYRDRYDITVRQFYEKMKTFKGLPKTSQVTTSDHYEAFKEYVNDYAIIYVPLSSKGSGTYQNAHVAKKMILEDFPDADITILDSMSFSYGYGMWLTKAAQLVKDGADKGSVIKFLEEKFAKTEILFAIDTLEYLEKGGRISPAAKILANVLDIKPILAIEGGLVMSHDKVRGSKKLYPKMISNILDRADDIENQSIGIVHANAPEKVEKVKELFEKSINVKEFIVAEIGACVGIHSGPGAIGIVYLAK